MQQSVRESALDSALSFLDPETLLNMPASGICDPAALALAFRERLAFHYPERYQELESLPLHSINWRREFIDELHKEFADQSQDFISTALCAREGRLDDLKTVSCQYEITFSIHHPHLNYPRRVPWLMCIAAKQQPVLDYFYRRISEQPELAKFSLAHYAICCRQPIEEIVRHKSPGQVHEDVAIWIDLLNCALEANNLEVAKYIVEFYRVPVTISLQVGEDTHFNPLMLAVILNRIEFIQFCADRRMDFDINLNARHWNIIKDAPTLSALIADNASILDIAVFLNHIEIINILEEAGVQYKFPRGFSPLHMAFMNGTRALIERFLHTETDHTLVMHLELWPADILKAFLEGCRAQNCDIDLYRDYHGNTLLHRYLHGYSDHKFNRDNLLCCVEMLLNYGANLHDECFAHESALYLPIKIRFNQMVDLLVRYGADLETFTWEFDPFGGIMGNLMVLALNSQNPYILRKFYMGHFTDVDAGDYHVSRGIMDAHWDVNLFFKALSSTLYDLYGDMLHQIADSGAIAQFNAGTALMRVLLQVDSPEVLLEHAAVFQTFEDQESGVNFLECYEGILRGNSLDIVKLENMEASSENAESGLRVSP